MGANTKLATAVANEFLTASKLIQTYEINHDEETLHDIRVSIRKIRSILSLANDFYDLKIDNSLKKKLKNIFDKSSEVRDIDTFLLFLEKEEEKKIYNKLSEKKELLLHELKASLHTLSRDKDIKESLKKISSKLTKSDKEGIGEFLNEDFRSIFFEYADVIREENLELEHLHEMRKRCKKTRYRLEVVDASIFKENIALCKEFQDRLGKINDFRVWLTQLEHFKGSFEETKEDISLLLDQETASFLDFLKKLQKL